MIKILLCLLSFQVHAKQFDFEFREMGLKNALESVARLEQKSILFSAGVQDPKIALSLRQVTPTHALQLLLKNYGLTHTQEGNVLRVLTLQERGPASTSTQMISLKHILAKEIETNIKTYLGNEGSVSVNEQSNALIINASDIVLERVRKLIYEMDRESHQIFIECKVVETSTTFSRSLGIEWGSPLGNPNQVAGLSLNAPGVENALKAGLSTSLSSRSQLEARLSLGERNGDLKVVSSPKITTLSGVSATIESLITFNIKTLTPIPGNSNNGLILAGSLESIKTGIRLKVTPFLMTDQKVRLDLSLSKSEPDFSKAIDGVPGVSDHSAITSLIVTTGETASIGGLIFHNQSTSKFGIPVLSKIPLLGFLFGSIDKKEEDRELLIFLTPTLFKNDHPTPEV